MNSLESFFRGKKVLVTGHTGFKGSWLSHILVKWGAHVSGIALEPATKPNVFESIGLKQKIKNYFFDIRDFDTVKKVFLEEKPEVVFHLAAQAIVRKSYDDPLATFETNIIGTGNVLHAIKETSGIRSVVIVTTDKVYENIGRAKKYREKDSLGGHDPYSASKAAAEIVVSSYMRSFFTTERFLKKYPFIASVRSGNVIGGGDWADDRLIPDIVRSVFESGEKVVIRNPDFIRPWQYVLEPLAGYILLAKFLYEGKKDYSGAWNFGPLDKNYVPVRVIVEKASKIVKRPLKDFYEVNSDNAKRESPVLKLHIGKAKSMLGWVPRYDIDTALRLTLEWYRHFYQREDMVDMTNKHIDNYFNTSL